MNDLPLIVSWAFTGTGTLLLPQALESAESSGDPALAWAQLIITALALAWSIGWTIYKGIKKAKKDDGKVSPDELADIIEDVGDVLADVNKDKDDKED